VAAVSFYDFYLSAPISCCEVCDASEEEDEVVMSAVNCISTPHARSRWAITPPAIIESTKKLVKSSAQVNKELTKDGCH
jgi:hypothetical protein